MQTLTPGANTTVPTELLKVKVTADREADVSAFRLYQNGKTKADPDFIFYGQKRSDDNTVILSQTGAQTVFVVDTLMVKPDVHKIAFAITSDAGPITNLGNVSIEITVREQRLVSATVPMTGRTETALILGELYRRNDEWKFRFVAQGFNGGLKPLAEHFGVTIADDQPAPTPAPVASPAPTPAPSKINLSKITLDKANPKISLEKKGASGFGTVKVNLNWNSQSSYRGIAGALFGAKKGVDLDLGAFVRLSDGYKNVVQALGNRFGSLRHEPFVELQGDDRSGQVSEGEWLHVNGERWKDIDEILIFAFIYDGVPNWDATDGVVTLHIPNQPQIETRLVGGRSQGGMCAIARLKNRAGQLQVERLNQYFDGHSDMDRAYGWGFSWRAGSK